MTGLVTNIIVIILLTLTIMLAGCDDLQPPTEPPVVTTTTSTSTSSTTTTTDAVTYDFERRIRGVFLETASDSRQRVINITPPIGTYKAIGISYKVKVGLVNPEPQHPSKRENKYSLLYISHGNEKDAYAYLMFGVKETARKITARHGVNLKWQAECLRAKYTHGFMFERGDTYVINWFYDVETGVTLNVQAEQGRSLLFLDLGFAIKGGEDQCTSFLLQDAIEQTGKSFRLEFGYGAETHNLSELQFGDGWQFSDLTFRAYK